MIRKGLIRFKKGAYKPYWCYPGHIVFVPYNKRRKGP